MYKHIQCSQKQSVLHGVRCTLAIELHGHGHFGVGRLLKFKHIVDCFVFVVELLLVECEHSKICKKIMVTVADWPLFVSSMAPLLSCVKSNINNSINKFWSYCSSLHPSINKVVFLHCQHNSKGFSHHEHTWINKMVSLSVYTLTFTIP